MVGPFILGRILSNLLTLDSTGDAAQGTEHLESQRPIDHGILAETGEHGEERGRGGIRSRGYCTVLTRPASTLLCRQEIRGCQVPIRSSNVLGTPPRLVPELQLELELNLELKLPTSFSVSKSRSK